VKRRVYNRREPAPGYPHSNNHHHITSSSPTVDLLLSCIQNHNKAPKQEISAITIQITSYPIKRSNAPSVKSRKAKKDRHKCQSKRTTKWKSKKDVRGIQGMGESNVKLREVSTQAKSGTGISVASGSWDVDFFAQRYRMEGSKGKVIKP
jgi:hypothetical protein